MESSPIESSPAHVNSESPLYGRPLQEFALHQKEVTQKDILWQIVPAAVQSPDFEEQLEAVAWSDSATAGEGFGDTGGTDEGESRVEDDNESLSSTPEDEVSFPSTSAPLPTSQYV